MKEQTYKIITDTKITLNLKIALLSDTHNVNPTRIIDSLSERAEIYGLDFVAISGDFFVGHRPDDGGTAVTHYKNVLPLISGCAKIAPTYLSLGNHEWMLTAKDIELLEEAGAIVLDNTWVRLPKGIKRPTSDSAINSTSDSAMSQTSGSTMKHFDEENILIGGLTSSLVTYYRSIEYNLPTRASRYQTAHNSPISQWLTEFENQPGFKILLSHHPEYWNLREPFLSKRKIDLVLSGHAHGGQFRIFGQGILSPGQGFFPKYTSGIHQGDYGKLIISKGLSNTAAPIPRLFNPTEIVYIEL